MGLSRRSAPGPRRIFKTYIYLYLPLIGCTHESLFSGGTLSHWLAANFFSASRRNLAQVGAIPQLAADFVVTKGAKARSMQGHDGVRGRHTPLRNNRYTATLSLKAEENAKNNCYINCYM